MSQNKKYHLLETNYYRFGKIDYLSSTGVYEFIFVGSLPKEVAEFKNLWLPFDNPTWISVLGAAIVVSTTLFLLEIVWARNFNDQRAKQKHDGTYILPILLVQV